MSVNQHGRIFLSPPHMSGKEQGYIEEAFLTNWIAPLGPNVDAFEQEVAAYAGVKGAVALSSGTAAIHLALCLLGIGPGDDVFCSSLTFVASANPIVYLGAEPVFIDSEPETWNMSPQALEKALEDSARKGKLPRAVVVVHLYGQSAKMAEISALCQRYGVPVVEDAAESLGSVYQGAPSGSMGKFGIYSFNGNKIITTSGGGMLISNDEAALSRARFLSTQARDPAPYYQHSALGYNYRMSNVLAGIGRAQLEVLDQRVKARRNIFNTYRSALEHVEGIHFVPELENCISNRWLTVMTIDEEAAGVKVTDVLGLLEADNIEARHVWKPLHMQPLFKDARYYPHSGEGSVSERLFREGICLPSGSALTPEQQRRVIGRIARALLVSPEHRSSGISEMAT